MPAWLEITLGFTKCKLIYRFISQFSKFVYYLSFSPPHTEKRCKATKRTSSSHHHPSDRYLARDWLRFAQTKQGSILPTFYVQLLHQQFCASKVQTLNLSTKNLRAQLTCVKAARRMLVKLSPGAHSSSKQTLLFHRWKRWKSKRGQNSIWFRCYATFKGPCHN